MPVALAAAVCLAGTLAGWLATERSGQRDLQGHFDTLVTRAALRVQSSLDRTMAVLRGVDALFASEDSVGPEELSRYVRRITAGVRDPGLLRLMYISADASRDRVGVGAEADFARQVPAAFRDGAPGRAQLAPVPPGLRSRQDRAEYIVALPVFRGVGHTGTVSGWAVAVVDAGDILRQSFGGMPDIARLEVLDAEAPGGAVFAAGLAAGEAALREDLPLRMAGREWTLRVTAGEPFARMFGDHTSDHVLQGGVVVTIVVVGVLIGMHRARESAVALREATEASAAAQERFLTTMSHELRTPLSSILGHSDLLRDPGLPEEERALSLQTIHRSGEHLLGMINELLDLSKVRSGRLEIEPRPCDVKAVVAEVVQSLRPAARAKSLELRRVDLGGVPASFSTDAARLRQILLNLVGNAIKFSERGWVELRIRGGETPGGELVVIEIEDTGIGIEAETQKRIFEAFMQADSSTSRKYGGTGLGLPISRGLARLLGGDLTVRSSPGVGSTFTLTLRTREAVALAPTAPVAAADPAPVFLAGGVLVVDDSEDIRRLQRHWLTAAGARVELAADGPTCLRRLLGAGRGEPCPGVVLLDMQMPEMDGYATARALRAGGFQGSIVAVTANSVAGDRQRCLDAGCDDYLSKPVEREVLVRTCAAWMPPGHGRAAA